MAAQRIVKGWWGREWEADTTELEAHLKAFRLGWTVESGALGKEEHFWAIAAILWGKASPKQFLRHPWAEKAIKAMCRYRYVAVSGAGSSGKTDVAAVWALVNFFAAPFCTTVLVTSTEVKQARLRIWGRIKEYYQAVPPICGRLLDSISQIRFEEGSDRNGISLIAGEQSKAAEAVKKLIGIKNDYVFLIADELPDLSESILNAAYGNLALNPYFQLVGLGNFASVFDPFGQFAEPKDGWGTVTEDSQSWRTKRGVCIRFDGLKSPNVLAGQDVYPGLYSQRHLAEHRMMGENSAMFWRMCRSFPAPQGLADQIFTESLLLSGDAFGSVEWERPPLRIAALDPAFTSGGDRSVLWIAEYGQLSNGKMCIRLDKKLELHEDANKRDRPHDWQIAEQFKLWCESEGVNPYHAVLDATGAGISFGSIVSQLWSPQVLHVCFGGAASDLPATASDSRPSSEVYVNRVAEIWYQGREFVRAGQFKGVTTSLARELCARKYDTTKQSATTTRIRVEPKRDMKLRLGFSPDEADAALMLIELARERFGFVAGQIGDGLRQANEDKERHARAADDIYGHESFLIEA